MKILTKYLLKSLIWPLFYCLLGFSLLFIINDLFDNFSDFLGSDIRPSEILYYYVLLLPPALVLILPACLLLAMLYSLSQLTRHSEITAMRAGGVSIYRIIMPFIGVGLLATLVCFLINEKIAPNAGYRAEQFRNYQTGGRLDETFFAENIALKDGGNDWYVQRMDTRDQSLYNVRLVQPLADGSGEIKYEAEKALWLDGTWWFMNATVQRYDEHGDLAGAPEMIMQKEMYTLTETPQTFMSEVKEPRYLSSREMKRYLESKKMISDSSRSRLLVDLHARLATPLVCFIVTLIGVPVGAHTGRRGAFAGIMIAMSLFFVFYALQLLSQYIAKQELMPAFLGGWLPVILFVVITPFMIYRMR
ncbi:LptF/LptG family permease [Tichowtungia aerotolerans]|uniref:LptF/LptG family permease n=1 Tax=Tichowtungia aerotolerans TaxID=2697043 RepID=A0A6P1MCB8_9BACT|nr:LptF/LptG family permease [Tichowtungia aerotolerans]QHI70753.1 LptF/LptG family permease [Tichowtungia aerotolerans]